MRFSFTKLVPSLVRQGVRSQAAVLSKNDHRLLDSCSLPPEKALSELKTSKDGLSDAQAEAARELYGFNALTRKEKKFFVFEILERFKNPLAVQLLIIGGISLWMGDDRSAVVVGAMVFLSVILSYVQETRSGKAVEQLQKMVQANTLVIRGGRETEIPTVEVVPGDIVVLHAGAIIPADLRLVSAKDFYLSQSALTGESMPIEKSAELPGPAPKNVIELPNACFQGSYVVSGAARGVVVNTGESTYLGSISAKLTGEKGQTSFDRGIQDFTWLMIRFMAVMVTCVFLIVGLTKGDWVSALLFSMSVAVGLTPEMLPMILTVNLSKGALVMSKKKVIVKRLNSIQNFGAIDILCTDKTGTITQDRIVLEKFVDVTNRSSEDVLRYAYMNSYYQTGLRNLLDRSILSHTELDVEKTCRKVDEIPFDFKRKRMSVIIEYEDSHVMITKGSVEDVYSVCGSCQIDDEALPLIDVMKRDLMEEYERLSRTGYRVLAVAYREFARDKTVFGVQDEGDLVLLGYLAFFDPPKDSAAKALAGLEKMGVSIKILTGDNELVTQKICSDVGLASGSVITGGALAELDEAGVSAAAEKNTVFARLSPSQKEQIIAALQKAGHVVGYMGDGINDAPALNLADVGISVDTAVDVAKESADIILLEKDLMVLEEGIIEGRKVFGNITKYIKMGASSNFGNMFSVVGGSYFLPFLPMLPIQILMNNLLYDISQIGIPTDNVDEEYLRKPKKWNIANIKKFMLVVGPISSVFDYATYFLMLYFFGCIAFSAPGAALADKVHLEKLFHTGWFVESLLTQTLIVYIIRTKKIPFLESVPSLPMVFATVMAVTIGVFLPHTHFADKLGFVPLPGVYWLWLGGFLLLYAVLTHNVKVWFYRKFGDD
ncbi:MAG: magnesium-translocating P-type ATPase [Elusimicrobiales bacterium]|nr:magnesium-translocating P-type ATPase [Elusimicrobiales bacterium]